MTEVCCDIAMGFADSVLWLVILAETLTTKPLMESAIGSQGVFFMFGIFCAMGALFNYCFVAETKGLSELERKSLYIPGAKYGRKLRPEERGISYSRVSIRERTVSVASIADRTSRKLSY